MYILKQTLFHYCLSSQLTAAYSFKTPSNTLLLNFLTFHREVREKWLGQLDSILLKSYQSFEVLYLNVTIQFHDPKNKSDETFSANHRWLIRTDVSNNPIKQAHADFSIAASTTTVLVLSLYEYAFSSFVSLMVNIWAIICNFLEIFKRPPAWCFKTHSGFQLQLWELITWFKSAKESKDNKIWINCHSDPITMLLQDWSKTLHLKQRWMV